MMFKVIFVTLLLQCMVTFSSQATVPNCDNARLDSCTAPLLAKIKGGAPVPATVEEVEAHCGEAKNASKCLRTFFRECATPSMKQMARTLYGGYQRKFKKACSPEGIQKILQNRACIVASRTSLMQCYDQGVKDMYAVRQSADKTKWHSMTCCFGSRGHNCALTAVKANCAPSSTNEFSRESSAVVDELMDMFCPTNLVWGSQQCTALVSSVPEVSLPKDREVTLLPIMMDIVKEFSVPEEEQI